MNFKYGNGSTTYGPGVSIELTGEEVATAISAWLVAHYVHVSGPRTIRVNDELCEAGKIYVDPSGFVITPEGAKMDGRGVNTPDEDSDDYETLLARDAAHSAAVEGRE